MIPFVFAGVCAAGSAPLADGPQRLRRQSGPHSGGYSAVFAEPDHRFRANCVNPNFLTLSGSNYSLTSGMTSTFEFSASDGSSVSGIFTSDVGSSNGNGQTFKSVLAISEGTGRFAGVTGNILLSNGSSNGSDSQGSFQVLGTSAAVPEASTTVSFGLLLAVGLGGALVAARRKRMAGAV